MRKRLALMTASLTLVVGTGGVSTAKTPMSAMFAKADQVFASRGFRPAGWARQGVLASGGTAIFALELRGSRLYQLSGMCDASCGDLDLELLDANGKTLLTDLRPDYFPLITIPNSGRFCVRVSMVNCTKPKCSYGLRTYIEKTGEPRRGAE